MDCTISVSLCCRLRRPAQAAHSHAMRYARYPSLLVDDISSPFGLVYAMPVPDSTAAGGATQGTGCLHSAVHEELIRLHRVCTCEP